VPETQYDGPMAKTSGPETQYDGPMVKTSGPETAVCPSLAVHSGSPVRHLSLDHTRIAPTCAAEPRCTPG